MISGASFIIGAIATALIVNKIQDKKERGSTALAEYPFWAFNDNEDYIIKYKNKEGDQVTPRPIPAYKMQETLYRLEAGGAKIVDFWGYDHTDQEVIKRRIRAIQANIEVSKGEDMKINFEKIVKRPHDSEELPERRQRNNKLNKPKRFGKIWRNHYDRKLPGLLLERERQAERYRHKDK
ncbi:hypothetical protein [Escherichia coli]|uniref:hypothetical protein n=1 Tax=Escherichia coli TaxID=562 RepID=UPI001FF41144|nr:hypothetical protein [Escherichia coli]MCK0651167.1 hypothetical protein [Escherichia coli]